MENLHDLRDLLSHELRDLLSVEDQILEALPDMIEKATRPELVKALKDHLHVTQLQRKRLDQVRNLMGDTPANDPGGLEAMLTKLLGGGPQKCKGMEGILSEGKKMLELPVNADIMDATIIACAQKVEHYEICGYGTARAYALELKLENIAILLNESLQEEYAADDLLTKLAVQKGLNEAAERPEIEKDGGAPTKNTSRKKPGKSASSFYGTGKRSSGKKPPKQKSATPTAAKKSSPSSSSKAPRKSSTAADTNTKAGTRGGSRKQGGKPKKSGRPPGPGSKRK